MFNRMKTWDEYIFNYFKSNFLPFFLDFSQFLPKRNFEFAVAPDLQTRSPVQPSRSVVSIFASFLRECNHAPPNFSTLYKKMPLFDGSAVSK